MGRRIINSIAKPPIVRLANATFFREHPTPGLTQSNSALFPGANLEIWPSHSSVDYWAIVGPAGSGKTTFLEILRGNHFCEDPLSRSYPYLPQVGAVKKVTDPRILRNRDVTKAVRYAGFGGKGTKLSGVETRGSYMAARYESRHEAEDFSLKDYLLGNTEANPSEQNRSIMSDRLDALRLGKVTKALHLNHLLEHPALVLSNGQTRRARIAKAFMEFPLLLLLDEPFLGIDPINQRILSPALWSLSRRSGPSIVITLSNDEVPPKWITHLICLEDCQIRYSGPKDLVYEQALTENYPLGTRGMKRSLWKGSSLQNNPDGTDILGAADEVITDGILVDGHTSSVTENQSTDMESAKEPSRRGPSIKDRWDSHGDVISALSIGEPIVEMKGVQVNYGNLIALGDWQEPSRDTPGLHWTIRRGERWGVFGPNGSGKTTILSLVNSDHPKSYSQSISYFGRSRLPEPGQPGISIFDLQSKIMQSSPEVHAFFPKHLSVRATLENAWADTFLSKARLTFQIDSTVDAALRWFEKELNPRCTGTDPLTILADWSPGGRQSAVGYTNMYRERNIDWADTVKLSELSFGAQRVALFLRAIIKKPDIVILDEAFSGMDKNTRIKCMLFLTYGETKWLGSRSSRNGFINTDLDLLSRIETPLSEANAISSTPFEARQALVAIAHEANEVPPLVDQYVFLEEPSSKRPPRLGTIPSTERATGQRLHWWDKLWNPIVAATNKDQYNRFYAKRQIPRWKGME